MPDTSPPPRHCLLGLLFLVLTAPLFAESSWRQWGGPLRDFKSDATGLATAWPEDGPELLWQRPLGEGYSGIVADGGVLFTMYHRGDDEVVIAVDADNGKTVWESAYSAPPAPDMNLEYGPGPHATPAIVGDRLFTAGYTLKIHALEKKTGKVLWARDLAAELGVPVQRRGFGASPLTYGDLLIVTPGGDGGAVAALSQADGEIVWKSQSFRPSYSSPILVNVDGEEQIVVAMGPDRAGLDPETGKLEWHLAVRGEGSNIMSTQLWGDDDILFSSAAYTDGSRAIRVSKKDGAFTAEELWYSSKMRVQHGTMVRLGDYVYGSSGDFGPTAIAAINVNTGELAFRQRGFAKANLLAAGGQLLILDEDGELAIGTPGPEGIEIHSRARILERLSWTVPTVLGTRLYVRDRKQMKAFELGLF